MVVVIARLRTAWGWFNEKLGLSVPQGFEEPLIQLQHKQLQKLVPLLYLMLALNSFSGAVAAQGDFPVVYQLIFPAIMIVASLIRYYIWIRRRHQTQSLPAARKHLRSTFIVAILLNLLGGFWTLMAYMASKEDVLATVFMIMSTFASVTCLWALPRAAMVSIIVGLGPLVTVMFRSKDVGIVAMAMSVTLVCVLQSLLIFGRFSEMVKGLVLDTELRRLAETDSLTGLANRRAFEENLSVAMANADNGDGFSLLMIDLDGFKAANDQFGHVAGDEILVQVARRLTALCHESECIARLGGDEFAIIIPGVAHADAEALGSAIRHTLSLPYEFEKQAIRISASFGAAQWPNAAEDPSTLVKTADSALYSDKSKRQLRKLAA